MHKFLVALITISLFATSAFAADLSPSSPLSIAPRKPPTRINPNVPPMESLKPIRKKLNKIQAKVYKVKIQNRSRNKRVYLVEFMNAEANELPAVGRIVLLRTEFEPVLAFQVLKKYPAQGNLALKKIRRYGRFRSLDIGEEYFAVEKIANLPETDPDDLIEKPALNPKVASEPIPLPVTEPIAEPDPIPEVPAEEEPPPPTAEPEVLPDVEPAPDADLAESPVDTVDGELEEEPPEVIETPEGDEVPAEDPPLEDTGELNDEGEVPDEETDRADVEEIEPQLEEVELIEISPLDPDTHWLSVGAGAVRNLNPEAGTTTYFTSPLISYGLTLGKELLFQDEDLQDSFSIEGSIGFYKVKGFVEGDPDIEDFSDSYTLLPLRASAHYNLSYSENFTLFFSASLIKNQIMSSVNSTQNGLINLQTTQFGAGVGGFFRFGPKWFIRVEIALDSANAGLTLRF